MGNVPGEPSRLDFAVVSARMTGVALASYVPLNAVKLMALRFAGARVGRGCALHHGLAARASSGISIGADCWIAENVSLDGRGGLEIGDHVLIGSGVQIWTAQHDWRSADFAYESAPVGIGDRAWVNTRSIVLPGVTIGEGAVVAAGAVVTKDVPPWTLVGGVPATVLGQRPPGMRYELRARRFKVWWW